MGYTRMTFLQFHRLIHSHSMSQSDYRYSLSSYGFGCYGTGTRLGGVLEIGFVEENPLVFHFPELGEHLTVQVDDIFIIPPNHRLEVSTLHPGEHKHTSVEFLIDCTTECLRQKTLSAQDCESIRGQTVILPYVIPASKENAELIALIRQLARDQMLMVEKNHFEECLACMRILAFIAARMQSKTGCGVMTMPAPPPTGVSSTEWCTSCVQSRRLCAVTSTRPFSCALPSRLRLSTSKYSGNTDTISIFIMFHNTGTPAKRGAYEKGAGIIASALLKKQRIRAPE